MSDIEASELLRKLLTDLTTAEKELEESDFFATLQARMEEIEEKSKTDPSDELKKEAEEIEKTAENLYEQISIKVLEGVSQSQMIEILNKITPEFIEENHFPKPGWFPGPFDKIVGLFLERINDPNHEIHNSLLANEQFTTAIDSSGYCLKCLIENTNDEKQVLQFLFNFSQNFGKADIKKSEHSMTNSNTEFGAVIEDIINSQNYSSEFKDYILSNQQLIPYISSFTFKNIISKSNLPKSKRLELLYRPDIFQKISDYDFSVALGTLCESYNDYHMALSDETISSRIKIATILENTTLKADELKKLLLDDKVYDQVDWLVLGGLLQRGKMDFETRKSILFEERLFSKLNELAIVNAITCKDLTSQQRFELINDERIFTAIIDGRGGIHGSSINDILQSPDIPITDKVRIARDERFQDHIDNRTLQLVMGNQDIPMETATEILFDKKMFYKLIGEWNDEYNHPEHFFGDKGPYRYDKYDYVQKLYARNPYIARTLSYELLKDDILDLGFDFIEKISKYTWVSQQLAGAFSNRGSPVYLINMIKTIENSQYSSSLDTASFVTKLIEINGDNSYYSQDPKKRRKLSKIRHTAHLDPSKFTEENWKTITEIGLRDMSLYYNGIQPGWGMVMKDEIDITLNILPDIETMEDLNNYETRRLALCDEYFKAAIEQRNLDGAKNAYLNKYFNVNIQEAQEIVRMFSHSIQEFSEKPECIMQTKYIEQLQKIINLEKIDTISDIYTSSQIEPLSFDETIFIDQSIRQMFSKQMSDNMFKITDNILNENGEYIPNAPREMEFVVEIDGVKTLKKVPVYEPGFDFKMLIHSTAAYGQMQLINDNYFDSWNKNGRKSNHGICCSMISNDNMGMAAVNDVLFGFDSWDPKAITKSSPYDIYSVNDNYDIQEGRPMTFMSAQDIIDNTRHTHNEHVLERYELRPERRTAECQNIQPSYVIIYSDMADEIKQKAIKCSSEMNIPIVYLDKEKIVQHEVSKINKKIDELSKCGTLEEKLNILEQILLSHENNRSGLKATNNDWMEQYFPTSKIEMLFEQAIAEIQTKYQETGNIADYFKHSSQLMDILERENKKFKVTMESTERQNYIDIPIDEYNARLIQFINPNLCRTDMPKLETIIQTSLTETPDLALSQAFASTQISTIQSQINDAIEKNLYPNNGKNHNIGHIERVIFLSQLVGRQELKLENGQVDEHAISLVSECAKYHDCGRESDAVDKKHGQKSANKMFEFLQQAGFSEEDIKIMQVAVEYHEEVDDDFRFEKICEKYGINSERQDYAKKIAHCLKDADALDRTRFSNPNAKLDANMLRFESSKDLIPIAEGLNRSYEALDRKQFIKSCQYMYQQSLLQSQNAQTMSIEQSESISQGRKK